MASTSPRSDGNGEPPEDNERKVELTLDLWMNPEDYRDEDGEINEDLMYREALTYAAEAAEQDEFDVAITHTAEESERLSERRDRQDTGTCPICDGCARYLEPDELRDS